MKLEFNTSTINPMIEWLMDYKKNQVRDEKKLRQILSLEDYQVEFSRYGMEGLPVCGISFEEAVDFFMNFDKKDFDNPRLQYKKPYFISFFNNIEANLSNVETFTNLNDEDSKIIVDLLEKGLPGDIVKEDTIYKIIFIVSIGNSLGWPYENYIDFDIANLGKIESKESFLHVIAHEIHHMYFGNLLPEDITPQQLFLYNFAFEGLAVHFNNNAKTLYKPAKYNGESFSISQESWKIYDNEFDELFSKFIDDYKKCKSLSEDEVNELISKQYEVMEYTSLKTGKKNKVEQYPTYYLGCYFWGSIDIAFGKDKLFSVMKNPSYIVKVYNEVAKKLGNGKYLIKE